MKNKYLVWCMFFCLKVVGAGGNAKTETTLKEGTDCHTKLKRLFNDSDNCDALAKKTGEINKVVYIGTDAGRWITCEWVEYDKRRTYTQCILRFNNTYGDELVCTYETKDGLQGLTCRQGDRCEDGPERHLLEEECSQPKPRGAPKRNKTERCLDEVYGSFSGHQECAKLKIGSEVAEQIIFRENGDDKTPECIEASGPPESKVVGEACVIKLRTEPHPSEYICKMEGSGEERKIKCTRETSKTVPQHTTTKKRRGSTGSMRKRSEDGGNTEVTLKEDKDETQDEDEGQKEERKEESGEETGTAKARIKSKTYWKSNNPIIMFLALSSLLL